MMRESEKVLEIQEDQADGLNRFSRLMFRLLLHASDKPEVRSS
jgi:hypothetical protein